MVLADAGGGNTPKKKKKPSSPAPSSYGTPSYAQPGYDSPYVKPNKSGGYSYSSTPSYSKPPSYARPSVKPPALSSSFDYFRKPVEDNKPSLGDLLSGKKTLGSKKDEGLQYLLSGQQIRDAVDSDSPDFAHSALQDFLGRVANPKAPKGYTKGAENLEPGEYAYAPDRFKTRKNGRLKLYWDQDYIESRKDDFRYPSQYQAFLNGIMEQQYQDQENWLLKRNYRQSGKIQDVLDDAGQAAYEGDFDYLSKYMEDHPNFDLEIPKYREEFGVSPEMVAEAWNKHKGSIKDPYAFDAQRYKTDAMIRHFDKLRDSYGKSHEFLNQAIARYEEKYNKSVDFQDADDAGPAIPEASKDSKEQQDFLDSVGENENPNDNKWLDIYGTVLSGEKYDAAAKQAHKDTVRSRQHAKRVLGLEKLPTVRQMLAYEVANGGLDPRDEGALDAAVERFRNPNHPDTRAMYLSVAMQQNPDFDGEGVGLKYVNAPIKRYQKEQQQAAIDAAEYEAQQDSENTDGVLDLISDAWHRSRDVPLVQDPNLAGTGMGDEATVGTGRSQLGWTFDKLSRLNYAVAGMSDAWFSLDKDTDHSWVDSVMASPVGAAWTSPIDEILKDPSGLGQVFEEGYQQALRGSHLPGTDEDIVPITFSNVIAHNAARDRDKNFYDQSWYQHVAGFGMDVGTDPLNLIGVGVVDDTLKLPVAFAKTMSEAQKADTAFVDTLNVLNKIEAPNMSPVAEKVFRVDQSIRRMGEDVGGRPIVSDADIEASQFDVMNLAHIDNQLADLKIEELKLQNDLGTDTLHEELASIMEKSPYLATKGELRVQRLMAKNSIPIKGTDLPNPGGRFWRDFLDPLHKAATSRGHYDVKYAKTVAGEAAQKADRELTQLLDDIDAGKLNGTDAAVIAKKEQLEDQVYNKAYERDPMTGSVPVTHEPNFESFYKAGLPGYNKFFDPAKAFADAMGVSRDEFPFSDKDIYDALTVGPRMYTEADPTAGANFAMAQERIDEAKRIIDNPVIPEYKKAAAYKALQIGYQMQSEVTLGGALHYLDNLQDMKWAVTERGIARGGLQERLDEVNKQIDEYYDKTGYQSIVDSVGGNYLGGFEGARGPGGSDISLPNSGTRSEQALAELREQKQQIQDELDQVALQEGGVDSLPPAAAYELDRILPANSTFRNADGTINVEKVEGIFRLKGDDVKSTHHVEYKQPKGVTNEDVGFLDRIRGAVESEYHTRYRQAKTEMTNFRKTGSINPDKPKVGPNEAKLGPRPTAESFRNQLPEYTKRELKGKTKDVRESSVPGKDTPWLHTDEDVVIDKVTGIAKAEQNLSKTGGKRTSRQVGWENMLKIEQKRWDKNLARARELDRAAHVDEGRDFKVSGQDQQAIQQRAFKQAMDSTMESLRKGKIKRVPGNMRLTINESARSMAKRLNMQHKADDLRLQIKQQEALSKEEFNQIQVRRDALLKEKKAQLKEIEKARLKAIETKKAARRVIGEEHILQIANAPARMSGKQIQFRLAGMRKNFQYSNNLFRGASKVGELIPTKFRENFANYMYRPSKQLDSREAIMFRAQWESKTPVIIKGHLERLNTLMRDISDTERTDMFRAYRNGTPYEGPKMDLYDGVGAELDDIVSIWNGKNDFYKFRDLGSTQPTSMSWHELQRFMPSDAQPNLRVLARMVKDDGGDVTAAHIIDAIKANGGSIKDLLDPYRFAWTMRLAADQARQYRALTHSMANTFGVRRGPAGTSRFKALKKLEDKYGWKTHKELGDYLFPPESFNDIDKLLEFTKPGDAHNKVTQLFDKAQGYWKQSMTIYNPGYYTRNGVGEIMASWLDGVNHPKWYRMAYRVHRFSKGADHDLADLVKKWSVLEGKVPVDEAKPGEYLFSLKGGLRVNVEDAYRHYVNQGLKSTFANTDLDRGVRGLASAALTKGPVRHAASKVNEGVHEMGEGFEDYLRMAHFLHAMEHSGKGTLHQAAMYAAERVRKYHFDYTDFSTFEKTVMLRAFPFYKWTRRGAPLMLAHLFMTPGKMVALPKAMDMMSGLGVDPLGVVTDDPVLSTQDVADDKNGNLPNYSGIAPGWVRDLFAYQMQPASDDEYGNYFRIQTPQVDGLNAVLGLTPGAGNSGLGEIFGDSAAYPLLSPAIKMPAELGMNQGMDPDFPYEIYGGEYNKMNGMNPLESIISYAARSLNPDVGFLAKMSKNGQLPFGNMGDGSYKDEHGFDGSRDIASFLTGAGFYQARADSAPTEDTSNAPAVGLMGLDNIPRLAGRKAAPKPTGNNGPGGEYNISDILEGYAGGGGQGSGWVNYPDRNYGGYSGSGSYSSNYSGGSVGGSSGSSLSFWDLIQMLRAQVDQGDVID